MPNDKDLQLLLLEKITEVGERTARMESEQQNMKVDLERIKEQDEVQNRLLDDHIRGVNTQAERLDNEIKIRKELESRVSTLEVGPKFRATFKQYLIGIGGIAGAIVAIAKLLKVSGLI